MASKDIESCGRCGLSSVVDASVDDPDPAAIRKTVYGGGHIEIDEKEFLKVSPHLLFMNRLQDWLDRLGWRLTYGRRLKRE